MKKILATLLSILVLLCVFTGPIYANNVPPPGYKTQEHCIEITNTEDFPDYIFAYEYYEHSFFFQRLDNCEFGQGSEPILYAVKKDEIDPSFYSIEKTDTTANFIRADEEIKFKYKSNSDLTPINDPTDKITVKIRINSITSHEMDIQPTKIIYEGKKGRTEEEYSVDTLKENEVNPNILTTFDWKDSETWCPGCLVVIFLTALTAFLAKVAYDFYKSKCQKKP